MSTNIIRNFAVAVLLSTTLMNSIIACQINEAELNNPSTDIGDQIEKLKSTLRHIRNPHAQDLQELIGKIDTAKGTSKVFHSPLEKDYIGLALLYFNGLYLGEVNSQDTTLQTAQLKRLNAPEHISDLFSDTPVDPAISQEAKDAKAVYDVFINHLITNAHESLTPDPVTGIPSIIGKLKIRGITPADQWIIDNFNPKIHKASEIEKISDEHKKAIKDSTILAAIKAEENQQFVRALRNEIAALRSGGTPSAIPAPTSAAIAATASSAIPAPTASGMSQSDAEDILRSAGIIPSDLGLTPQADGRTYLTEAFKSMKDEAKDFETALAKNTATIKELRSRISAAK